MIVNGNLIDAAHSLLCPLIGCWRIRIYALYSCSHACNATC